MTAGMGGGERRAMERTVLSQEGKRAKPYLANDSAPHTAGESVPEQNYFFERDPAL